MTKLALCFSGHCREYEKCYPIIKSQILDKYDCDIFMFIYYESDELCKKIEKMYNPKSIVCMVEDINYQYLLNNYIISNVPKIYVRQGEIYNSKTIDYESGKYYYDNMNLYNNYTKKYMYYSALSQFFGIYECARLCNKYIQDNNVEYDYIIRMRMDNTITNEFTLPISLNEGEVIVNKILDYSDSIKVHDHFFICRPKTYFIISNLCNNIANILRYVSEIGGWIPEHGYHETFLFIHMVLNNIKIKTTEGIYYIHKYNDLRFLNN